MPSGAALDPVGARRQHEGPLVVERDGDLAADLGLDRGDIAAPGGFPIGKPGRDALEPRPPQRARLGPLHQRREIFFADLAQRARGIGGKLGGEGSA